MSAAPLLRPRLVPWARLRLDPKTGEHVLLYPEKGLLLNASAAQIVKRCTGEYTVPQIAAILATEHASAEPAQLEADAGKLVLELAKRGLLRMRS